MEAIDTHIHLDMVTGLKEQIDEAEQAGITRWVVPGVDPKNWSSLLATMDVHNGIYVAPGIHPEYAEVWSDNLCDRLNKLLTHPRAVAIGEVGLDRQLAVDWHIQEQVFIEMIRLAKDLGKPLLIHSRKATERVLELLRQEDAQQVGGFFHAFSGSTETAWKIVDAGFSIGIGGIVTWPSAKRLPEVIKSISPENLVLETDAPFMTPTPYQGQGNRAAYLVETIKRVAELKGWSVADVVKVTSENASRVLKLPLAVNQ